MINITGKSDKKVLENAKTKVVKFIKPVQSTQLVHVTHYLDKIKKG